MYTLLCVFCMFSLVYEGPTADELRSVGLIAYFMKFVGIHVYFLFVPSVNKVFIIISERTREKGPSSQEQALTATCVVRFDF